MDKNIEIVRRHLMTHGTITNIEARDLYNILHIAEYIRRLRVDGMRIKTTFRKAASGRTFGVYVYTPEPEQFDLFAGTPYAKPTTKHGGTMLLLLAVVAMLIVGCTKSDPVAGPSLLEQMNASVRTVGMRAKARPIVVRVDPLGSTVSVRAQGATTCRMISLGDTAHVVVPYDDTLHITAVVSRMHLDTVVFGDTLEVRMP